MKELTLQRKVKAEPMTRLAYNEFRGWTLPSNENGADLGYKLTTLDGKHVSWSPREVVDSETISKPSITTYIDRLNTERKELSDKVTKLEKYIDSVNSEETEEPVGFDIHIKQLDIMKKYLAILGTR